MNRFLVAVLVLSWSIRSSAIDFNWPVEDINPFAFEESGDQEASSFFHSCEGLNLSEDQMRAFREVRKLFLSEIADLKVRIRRGRLQYKTELKSKDVSETQATITARVLGQLKKTLRKARKTYIHTVFYEIALPDQRSNLFRCFSHLNHHRKVQALRQQEFKHQQYHHQRQVQGPNQSPMN